MGSLMAGWDSPVSDPESAKFQRNKSLTKEEIDAFWRSKRQKEEEHLRDISSLSPRTHVEEFVHVDDETNLEKLIQTHGWWMSSNWAHLNEPPVNVPEKVYKYASQFHVAKMATAAAANDDTNNHRTGISA